MQPWDRRAIDGIRRDILPCLPEAVRRVLLAQPEAVLATLEEVRLRQGRPLMLVLHDRDITTDHVTTADDMARALQLVSQSSLYALEEELRQGFLTLSGGHRVGFAGRAVVERGRIKTIKHISGLNVRVSRELPGSADSLMPHLIGASGDDSVAGESRVRSCLIIGPPRSGKTTLLRDICRQLSDGSRRDGIPGLKVGLVDERSEIAGCHQGVPQRDVGLRTDVLDGCPKAEGMMLLIRSMSPDVIVTDELGRAEDAAAVEEAANAGVAVVATVHGFGLSDMTRRPSLRQLVATGVFRRLVILGRQRGPGTIVDVFDDQAVSCLTTPPVLSEVGAGADRQAVWQRPDHSGDDGLRDDRRGQLLTPTR